MHFVYIYSIYICMCVCVCLSLHKNNISFSFCMFIYAAMRVLNVYTQMEAFDTSLSVNIPASVCIVRVFPRLAFDNCIEPTSAGS